MWPEPFNQPLVNGSQFGFWGVRTHAPLGTIDSTPKGRSCGEPNEFRGFPAPDSNRTAHVHKKTNHPQHKTHKTTQKKHTNEKMRLCAYQGVRLERAEVDGAEQGEGGAQEQEPDGLHALAVERSLLRLVHRDLGT
jgi:hypothetical protein